MAVNYNPTNWENSPSTATPTSAANFNKIETALVALAAAVNALESAGVSWEDILDKPGTFPAAAPEWGAITGKPSTFAPTIGTTATTAKAGNYQPAWADVTGKPTIPSVAGLAKQEDLDAALDRIAALETAGGGGE